MNKPALN